MSATYHLRKAEQVLARGVRPHYVYFLLAVPSDGGEAVIKIGTAVDIDRRLSGLRRPGTKAPEWVTAGHIKSFYFVGWVHGDGELERILHRAYADHALVGEWFTYEPIRASINNLLRDSCVCRGCEIGDSSAAHL